MSTLSVVEEIMRETKTPMSPRQIIEHAAGRLPTRSRIPVTVVSRDLSMDIKLKGTESLFVRIEAGRFTLRELCPEHQPAAPEQAAPTPPRSGQTQRSGTARSRGTKSPEGARRATSR